MSEKSAARELSHALTPSINSSLLLKHCDPNQCEQLYADVHCHGEALHRMKASHAFCSEWPYAVVFSVLQYNKYK
jgi:hypothetical protein